MLLKRTKYAAVLGCGPAGLFATHALAESGWDVTVFSNKRRSEMFGAQYLHQPIPGLPTEMTELHYRLHGTPEEYRRKVYGDAPVGAVSPEILTGTHIVCNIRVAYYAAWDRYANLIKHRPGMGAAEVTELLEGGGFKLVVSSLPAPSVCYKVHRFPAQRVWAVGDAPERGIFCPVAAPANTVMCNGETAPSWYRASNVFGYKTCEWPEYTKPPVDDVAEVIKPLMTDCDCHMDDKRYLRVGRYGTWMKGVLSHQAYLTTKERAS